MSKAVTWHRLRVGPSDMYLPRKASFKDSYSRKAPAMCSRIVFRTVFSLYVSNKSVFLYHIYFEGLVLMFLVSMLRTGCYVKQMKSIQFFNPSSVIYMRTLVNSSTIAYICWLIQAFKDQFCGFQMHFKSILVYNLKTKGDFDQNVYIT